MANFASLERIREIAAHSHLPTVAPEIAISDRAFTSVRRALAAAGTEYRTRASHAVTQAGMLVLMLAAFALFYVGSRKLARANALLLNGGRGEALCDALTGWVTDAR